MIDSNNVKQFQRPAQTIDPPLEVLCAQPFPIVKRIAPKLARLRKIIRWDPGDGCWSAVLIELKEFAMRPDVGRIVRYEDRKVADDLDAALTAIAAKRFPLTKENELEEFLFEDLLVQS